MDIQTFLTYALTAGGAGAIDFGLIKWYDARVSPLSPKLKYFASIGLAVLIPGAALLVEVALKLATLSPASVFSVLTVAWLASQATYGTANVASKNTAPATPQAPEFVPKP